MKLTKASLPDRQEQEAIQDSLQMALGKAWEDKAFKKELVADPVEAIEKLTDEKFTLPKGKRLIVTDQSEPEVVYLNICPSPDINNMELNEEQLELVAGGWDIIQELKKEIIKAIMF